jgi:hypothetical protein
MAGADHEFQAKKEKKTLSFDRLGEIGVLSLSS